MNFLISGCWRGDRFINGLGLGGEVEVEMGRLFFVFGVCCLFGGCVFVVVLCV